MANNIEQYQKQCQELETTIKQLRHGLSKISVAANGIHPHLDRQLGALRREIRLDANQDVIQNHVSAITKTILKLDESKQKQRSELVKMVDHLIVPLQSLPLSPKQNKALDKLNYQIRQQEDEHNIVLRFHQVFAAIIKRLKEESGASSTGEKVASQEKSSKGFWGRWSGGSQPVQDTDSSYANLCEQLLALVENIAIPQELEKHYQDIVKILKTPLSLDAIEDVVNDIAELLTQSSKLEQMRLGSFLDQLSDRLEDVDQFLKINKDSEQDGQQNAQVLEDGIKDEIKKIKEHLLHGKSLPDLIEGVSGNLDNIGTNLQEFKIAEHERRTYSEEQFQALEERLNHAEREADELRINLSYQRLRAQSDSLTELPNREAYNERLAEAYKRYQRNFGPLCLAVCDIDFFKKINDSYGHMAGDKVLKTVAGLLKASLRAVDFICRFGGEEFVILLENTNIDSAHAVMEKLRQKIEACKFHFRDKRVMVTVSFGVCAFKDKLEPEEVFSKADEALYQAKKQGRNRIVIAN